MNDKKLPVILYRIFGKQDIKDVGIFSSHEWRDRVAILTTTDFGDDKIEAMRGMGLEVIPPICTNNTAGENSALFLNSGLEYLKKKSEKYAFLMASGYQGKSRFIGNFASNIMEEYPNRDIYFFLAKGVNSLTDVELKDNRFSVYANRDKFIPSESSAIVKIESVYPLDEELTRKGALGQNSEGIPLGGIELPVTVMRLFSQGKTLDMCAIDSSIVRESETVVMIRSNGSFEFGELGAPVEYTSTRDKLSRRIQTIDKVMDKLGITPDEYPNIFEKTILINEDDFLTKASPD